MSPNIYSCDKGFLQNTLNETKGVCVVVGWADNAEATRWVEELSTIEDIGIPVHVADLDSCGNLGKELNLASKQVAIYRSGKEIGRVIPSGDSSKDFETVKKFLKDVPIYKADLL